eukprot:UN03366
MRSSTTIATVGGSRSNMIYQTAVKEKNNPKLVELYEKSYLFINVENDFKKQESSRVYGGTVDIKCNHNFESLGEKGYTCSWKGKLTMHCGNDFILKDTSYVVALNNQIKLTYTNNMDADQGLLKAMRGTICYCKTTKRTHYIF